MTLLEEQPRTLVRGLPSQPTRHRSPRGKRFGALLLAVALIAAVTYSVGHPTRPADRATQPAASSTSDVEPAGAPAGRAVAGVFVGYPHTREGGESAATNYAVAYGSARMFDGQARHRIIKAIADPAVEPSLQTQLDASFGAVTTSFGLDSAGRAPAGLQFVDRTLPVGVHTVSNDGKVAQVEVWTAGLIGLAGAKSTKPVAEAWNTITLTLRWTAGDWKWVSFRQADGPTPVSGFQPPSGAATIADAARTFGGLRYAR